MEPVHVPVMKSEVLELLQPRGGGWIVDGCIGLGGHSEAIFSIEEFTGGVLGVDRDPEALAIARRRLEPFEDRLRLHHAEFAELGSVLQREGLETVDGLLLDLGVSSMQLDNGERGFSFLRDGPLDMRMNQSEGKTASELLSRIDARELERILREYGEERYARRIARASVDAGRKRRLETTGELADVISKAARGRRGSRRLHPATRSFQAIRLFINDEMKQLDAVMKAAPALLAPGGRFVALSYHSLEDRIVKHTLREQARQGHWEILTRKPLRPGPDEGRANPRSRSARLRAAVRTDR